MSAPITKKLAAAIATIVFAAGLFTAPVSGHEPHLSDPTVADIKERDELIAAQEALLNVYRCLFDVDTQIVPGGCADGVPVRPAKEAGTFKGTPTTNEVSKRDHLIGDQEELLNVYRCKFDVDTQIVPGGCADGVPAVPADNPPITEITPVPTADPRGDRIEGCLNPFDSYNRCSRSQLQSREALLKSTVHKCNEDGFDDGSCRYPQIEDRSIVARAKVDPNGDEVARIDPAFAGSGRFLMPFNPEFPDGYPLTVEDLGCDDFTPRACRMGADGFPEATRRLTHAEIDANVPYQPNPNAQDGTDGRFTHPPSRPTDFVPLRDDEVAFHYIDKCLRNWPAYRGSVHPGFRFTGDPDTDEDDASPVVACNAVWIKMGVPINVAVITDLDCLWNEFEAFYFRERPTVADRYGITLEPYWSDGMVNGKQVFDPYWFHPTYMGWGEMCDSWIDPAPGPVHARFTRPFRCEPIFDQYVEVTFRPDGIAENYTRAMCGALLNLEGETSEVLAKTRLRGRVLYRNAGLIDHHAVDRSTFPTPIWEDWSGAFVPA